MPITVGRKPRRFTVDEVLSDEAGLPEKMELINGIIGPFDNQGKVTMLANWGVDEIIRLTGPEIWREALAASENK